MPLAIVSKPFPAPWDSANAMIAGAQTRLAFPRLPDAARPTLRFTTPAYLSPTADNRRRSGSTKTKPTNSAPGTSAGPMRAKVLLSARAIVTAGLANEVEAVNQYAPVM
jgi:hypothetical protein